VINFLLSAEFVEETLGQ